MRQEVEITLWPDKRHLIGDEVIPGDIVAITSTMVTQHNDLLQLESTYLTTVLINPDVPQIAEHVHRLQAIPPMQLIGRNKLMVTLLDLKLSSHQRIQTSRNFTCKARITHIHDNRGWYYVVCSKCSSKLYPEQENDQLIFVCKDDKNIVPNFRYCVNTTITDATGSADAVFFNESMQEILNVSCQDMVTEHADAANPRHVPDLIRSIVDIPRILQLTLKNDGQIVVNNAADAVRETDIQSPTTVAGTSAFTPTTPAPKSGASKRQLPETAGGGRNSRTRRLQQRAPF